MKNQVVDLPLYFLGNRDYVNAPTLLEETIKSFLNIQGYRLNEITKISLFKVSRFVKNNCYFEVLKENASSQYSSKDVVARLNFRIDETLFKLLLFECDNSPVNQSLKDYDRSIYIQNECINDGYNLVQFRNIDNLFSLIRGIIEANYRYCVEKLKIDQKLSFAYLKDLIIPDFSKCIPPFNLIFKHKLVIRAARQMFIVNEIGNEHERSEICFFYSGAR